VDGAQEEARTEDEADNHAEGAPQAALHLHKQRARVRGCAVLARRAFPSAQGIPAKLAGDAPENNDCDRCISTCSCRHTIRERDPDEKVYRQALIAGCGTNSKECSFKGVKFFNICSPIMN